VQYNVNMYLPQVKYHVENEQEEYLPCRINHVLKCYLSTEKVILNIFFIFVDVMYITHSYEIFSECYRKIIFNTIFFYFRI
jgi:hypothetical protein